MALFSAAPASPLLIKETLAWLACSKAAMTGALAEKESWVITVRVSTAGRGVGWLVAAAVGAGAAGCPAQPAIKAAAVRAVRIGVSDFIKFSPKDRFLAIYSLV
jgi:hypothetical protein